MSRALELTGVKQKLAELEAAVVSRFSDPIGTRIDLQTQVKGKLPLENVDVGPIIEVLQSIVKALESL